MLGIGGLNFIAAGLRVSIPAADTLVAGFSLSLSIGGPILTALTNKLIKWTILILICALIRRLVSPWRLSPCER